MAKKIQDGNQIVTNVDSNDNLTFSIKSSFIDSTPTANSTNLVTSGGVKSALDINTTDIAAAVIRIANNETNISNNTSAIKALENAVSTNTTNISTNTTDIDTLETTVGTLSTNISNNTTNIGTLSNLTTTSKTNLVNAINELETDKLETSAVVNEPSTETDEVYSSDYLNDKLVSVGATAPTDGRRVWFKKGKNLISGWQQGFWGTTDGSYNGTRTDYICTHKILVKPNTTYTYSHGIGNRTIYVMEYGENDNYLSYKQFNDSSQIHFTTSENTYYVGIDITLAGHAISPSDMREGQLEEGSTATTYEPYIEKSINVDEEEWFKKIPFEDVTSKVSVSFVGGSISASDIGSLMAQNFYHIAPHIYIGNLVLTNVTSHYNNDQMQITFEVNGIGTILKCVGSGGNYDRQFASVFDGNNNNIYVYIQKGANASTSNFGATYRCIFITLED